VNRDGSLLSLLLWFYGHLVELKLNNYTSRRNSQNLSLK